MAVLTWSRRAGVAALAGTAAGPFLYPLWLAFATRGRGAPTPPEPTEWPAVAAVVPAYLERHVVQRKIEDLRANGYPAALRVVVVAEDAETADAARRTGAEVIAPAGRLGKAEALNRGIAACQEEVIVITDANTLLSPGALAALVRWFDDPAVGAVAGEKRVSAAEQGFYWHLEAWLKRRESLLGSTIGMVGELAAFRRSLYRPMPADISADDLWIALEVLEQGSAVRCEPTAVAVEEPTSSLREEWARRTRTVCAVTDVVARHRHMLAPGNASGVAAQLWGHRLGRYLGAVAHAGLLAISVAWIRRGPVPALFAGAHAYAGWALVRRQRGGHQSAVPRLASQVAFMQLAGIGGVVRYVAGDRPALWQKEER